MKQLPEIFELAGTILCGPVGELAVGISRQLSSQVPQTAGFAIETAIKQTNGLQIPDEALSILQEFSSSLGLCDLDSQLAAIQYAENRLQEICRVLQAEKKDRFRCYGSVCACAGIGLLLILL